MHLSLDQNDTLKLEKYLDKVLYGSLFWSTLDISLKKWYKGTYLKTK